MERKRFKHKLMGSNCERRFTSFSIEVFRKDGKYSFGLNGYGLREELLCTFDTIEEAFAYADALPEE